MSTATSWWAPTSATSTVPPAAATPWASVKPSMVARWVPSASTTSTIVALAHVHGAGVVAWRSPPARRGRDDRVACRPSRSTRVIWPAPRSTTSTLLAPSAQMAVGAIEPLDQHARLGAAAPVQQDLAGDGEHGQVVAEGRDAEGQRVQLDQEGEQALDLAAVAHGGHAQPVGHQQAAVGGRGRGRGGRAARARTGCGGGCPSPRPPGRRRSGTRRCGRRARPTRCRCPSAPRPGSPARPVARSMAVMQPGAGLGHDEAAARVELHRRRHADVVEQQLPPAGVDVVHPDLVGEHLREVDAAVGAHRPGRSGRSGPP